MKITADTNVLVRAMTEDDKRQSRAAQAALAEAESVAVTLPALCEVVWVLAQGYRNPAPAIAAAIRQLMNAENVVADRLAVEAGLALLDAGGDFADGIIAYAGRWLGGETFVSFDRTAVRLLAAQGQAVHALS